MSTDDRRPADLVPVAIRPSLDRARMPAPPPRRDPAEETLGMGYFRDELGIDPDAGI